MLRERLSHQVALLSRRQKRHDSRKLNEEQSPRQFEKPDKIKPGLALFGTKPLLDWYTP